MKHVAKVTKEVPASAYIWQWWTGDPINIVGQKAAYIAALFPHNGSLRTDDTANSWFFNPN